MMRGLIFSVYGLQTSGLYWKDLSFIFICYSKHVFILRIKSDTLGIKLLRTIETVKRSDG